MSKEFTKTVTLHYKKHARVFPWRETHDPYKILVSEIMLQQTQTNRVLPKYLEFIKKFPTIKSLANSPLKDVLKLWQGLGYNRRAKFLHECAKEISKKYNGKFPADINSLQKLPGIGQSTAGAILNFAFEMPTPFIETNIRTVFIHHFFDDKKVKVSDKEILEFIEKTLPNKNTRDWFYALYDYGSYLKQTLPKDPSQKSFLYKKQSKFVGSFRQKRAFVLSHLLKHEASKDELQKILKDKKLVNKNEEVKKILTSLLKDGLIKEKKVGKNIIYFAG